MNKTLNFTLIFTLCSLLCGQLQAQEVFSTEQIQLITPAKSIVQKAYKAKQTATGIKKGQPLLDDAYDVSLFWHTNATYSFTRQGKLEKTVWHLDDADRITLNLFDLQGRVITTNEYLKNHKSGVVTNTTDCSETIYKEYLPDSIRYYQLSKLKNGLDTLQWIKTRVYNNGKLVKERNLKGRLDGAHTTTYQYNEHGDVEKKSLISDSNTEEQFIRYQYDAQGIKLSCEKQVGEAKVWQKTMYYPNGLIKSIEEGNTPVAEYQYTYDSKGNWLTATVLTKGVPTFYYERVITYYD